MDTPQALVAWLSAEAPAARDAATRLLWLTAQAALGGLLDFSGRAHAMRLRDVGGWERLMREWTGRELLLTDLMERCGAPATSAGDADLACVTSLLDGCGACLASLALIPDADTARTLTRRLVTVSELVADSLRTAILATGPAPSVPPPYPSPLVGAGSAPSASRAPGPLQPGSSPSSRPATAGPPAPTARRTAMLQPLLLPGQSAAPPGPADMTMMYVLHHAFRRDLRDFRAAVDGISLSDRRAWVRLRERWQLFTGELHAHHVKEDAVLWPLLTERAALAQDHDAVRVLQEMEEEHAVLDPILTSCDASFSVLANGEDLDEWTGLVRELAELESVLNEHLGHEEQAAVAILQRYVGGEEWDRLEREKFRGKQSLGHARRFIPWAFKGLPPEAAERVGQLGGAGMRTLLALSRRRFERGEAAVFGV